MIDGEVIGIVLVSGLGIGFLSGILVAALLGREKKATPVGDRFTCVARGERSGGLWVDLSVPPIEAHVHDGCGPGAHGYAACPTYGPVGSPPPPPSPGAANSARPPR